MGNFSNNWGMAASTARELLAKSGGKNVMVRESSGEGSGLRHARRAMLIEVLNDKTARIKPLQGHKKTEDVPLSTLKFWKSANAVNGVHLPMPTATPIAEPVKKTATSHFVVLSRSNGGVWGGESLQWTTNPLRGITYEEANAKRARHALSLKSDATDAEVVTKEEAMTILGQMRGPVGTSHLVVASKVAHAALYPAAKPARSTLRPRASSGFDIDAILEEDDSALLAARANRKAAAQEVKEAQQILADAVAKLEEAQRHYENCMGHVQPGREEQAPTDREKRGYTKRGALKGTIQKILLESSHLSRQAIIEKVKGRIELGAENPDHSITQCLYGMKSADEIEKNEHGAIALTAHGRQKATETANK